MKKTVFFSVMLAGAATCLGATEVTTANTIGLMQVADTSKEYLLVAVPWLDYGTGTAGIKIEDLIKTANLTAGDKLYVAKSGGYDVYELSNNKTWEAVTAVTVGSNGAIIQGNSDSAASRTVTRGDAIWLQRSSTKNAFYIFGQKAASNTATVSVAAGLNLVASPSADGLVLASGITGCTSGDEIIINGSSGEEAHYYYRAPSAGGSACWCKVARDGFRKTYVAVTTETIPAGTGFWYKAADDGTITL